MTRFDRIAAVQNAGWSNQQLARDLACSRSAISRVLHGHSRSRRIEARIAELTGISLCQMWPEWYSRERDAA